MLASLRIKNLALVDEIRLELSAGLVAITGETGAGKSVIIGALNLLLGQRADRNLLRAGAESCTVEAVFEVARLGAGLAAFLEEHGLEPCDRGQLILKRTFSAAGTNRQFINGSPATLDVLSELGDRLVDMHGPHDHQSLLRTGRQLAILDAYGGLESKVQEFGELARQRSLLEREKSALIVDEQTYAQQLDLLRHQTNEIAAAQLKPDEEAEVEHQHQRASNAAKLLQVAQAALNILSEEDNSLLSQAGAIGRFLQEIKRLDPAAEELVASHGQALALLHSLSADLARYADRIELDPARLQSLEDRLNLIHGLKRKYGNTLAAVLEFGQQARAKLNQLESRDAEIERINRQLADIGQKLVQAGRQLSLHRQQVIPKLAAAVGRQLADLGFRKSQFLVELTSLPEMPAAATAWSASGLDTIEFMFAPNPGEPARPLRAIASSGEMARVMLALKTVLAVQDEIPVLVFDEVDANVGGETAQAVGEKMRQIARRRQVLCITHLAPVAAAASSHCLVTKELHTGRTISRVQTLDREERITELARMLGGQSEAARRHAESLLTVFSGP